MIRKCARCWRLSTRQPKLPVPLCRRHRKNITVSGHVQGTPYVKYRDGKSWLGKKRWT